MPMKLEPKRWVHAVVEEVPFRGATPLAYMTDARLAGVRETLRFASRVPCIPGMFSHCGEPAGNVPSPMSVAVTGARVSAAMDGFDADVAAARRILDGVQGSTVLVGHSYGGAVITELGTDEKVRSLVYVAALEPDVGESLATLSKRFPPAAMHAKLVGKDRFTPDLETLRADRAADLPEATTAFLSASLKPTPLGAATASVDQVGWKAKPSYGILATQDRTISPDLERFMYRRAHADVTEIRSSHMVLMSYPKEVAKVIMKAVEASD